MAFLIDVEVHRGALEIAVAFDVGPGVTALFGPSGAGKTSILNMIAGILRPARGRIVADGVVMFDSTAHVDLPTQRRGVGYVFQDDRLFPHLSVRGNLTYGYRLVPPDRRYVHPTEVVPLLGLTNLMDRRPATLSGGEQQRVAIGRALLTSPRVLLLDEPLSSLDANRKAEIMPYLERLAGQLRVPMIYVTHDFREVERLARRIVHLAAGRVVRIEETAAASTSHR